jgi:hypothetical protein
MASGLVAQPPLPLVPKSGQDAYQSKLQAPLRPRPSTKN